MMLSEMLSLAILNYFLLATKVSFQCGASKIKVSKLKKERQTHSPSIWRNRTCKTFFLFSFEN